MSQAASQATEFYREVAAGRRVFALRDDAGFPAPINTSGTRAMPFWSSRRRARRIVRTVEAYASFQVVAIDWDAFRDRWLPGLKSDGLFVGANWSGPRAQGYDVEPEDVATSVAAAISHLEQVRQRIDMTPLARYLRDQYTHLMTDAERRALRLVTLRQKMQTAERFAARLEHLRQMNSEAWRQDDEVDALLADGEEAFWERVQERLLREHGDEIVVNRCERCGAVAATPKARQCLECGHDWH